MKKYIRKRMQQGDAYEEDRDLSLKKDLTLKQMFNESIEHWEHILLYHREGGKGVSPDSTQGKCVFCRTYEYCSQCHLKDGIGYGCFPAFFIYKKDPNEKNANGVINHIKDKKETYNIK